MSKASLNELMGKGAKSGGRKLSLEDLKEMLGERAPKIEYSPVGRLRLTSALRQRFGNEYMQLPGIDDALKEFDEAAKFAVKIAELKLLKAKGK